MEILIIILSILRILGFILLGILLIAILVILLVLFIPIRYSIYGEKKENNETTARVDASWFFRVLNCCYYYEANNPKYDIKILGYSIIRNKKVKSEAMESEQTLSEQILSEQTLFENAESKQAESKVKEQENDEASEEKDDESEIHEKESNSFKDKLNKLNFVIDKIKFVYSYPQREEIQRLTIKLIKKLAKSLKPKIFKIDGEVGFDSPDTTGYFMAGVSVLIFTKLDINLKGNFEKQIFIAKVIISGKARISSILWPIGKYVLKKPIRNLIKQLR